MNRRHFLLGLPLAVSAAPRKAREKLTPKERVDLVLAGKSPDRVPFTFWHHFGDAAQPGLKHASATLEFQRKFRLDVVKVMSDYAYPKAAGANWWELKEERNPFPEQLKALELIRDGLAGQKHFVETIFNPFNQATKLSSKQAVLDLLHSTPQVLLDALEAIARSEARHARAALEAGASGIFLAVDNAAEGVLTRAEYRKFSEPFDRLVLEAATGAPMNTLHLHGDKVYLDLFWKGWPAPIINYSAHGTRVSFAEARRRFSGVLMGGLSHEAMPKASNAQLGAMRAAARVAAPRWICAPGCSVPDDSPDAELGRISRLLRA